MGLIRRCDGASIRSGYASAKPTAEALAGSTAYFHRWQNPTMFLLVTLLKVLFAASRMYFQADCHSWVQVVMTTFKYHILPDQWVNSPLKESHVCNMLWKQHIVTSQKPLRPNWRTVKL
jgi:hypothetical protein